MTELANEQDLQVLYQRYARVVLLRCTHVCGNPTDAEEALQETFLRAWRFRERFDGRHPLGWLQRIASRASIDLLRRRRRREHPWAFVDEVASVFRSPHDRIEANALLRHFRPEDAVILRLRYVEDWDLDEIADHLDTSRRTISRRLERLERRARAIVGVEEESV